MKRHIIFIFSLISLLTGAATALHPNANDPLIHCTHMTIEKCEKIKKKPSKCFDEESMRHVVARNGVPLCDDDELLHLCYCSCFHPDTKILASLDGSMPFEWYPISQLVTLKVLPYVAVVGEDSSIKSIRLTTNAVEKWLESVEPIEMIEIKTALGRQITLTGLHALLTSSGHLKLAQDVQLGDELVGFDGRREPVVSIESVISERGLLNLLTVGDTNQGHLIAANELIVGDLAWENWLLGQISEAQVRQE